MSTVVYNVLREALAEKPIKNSVVIALGLYLVYYLISIIYNVFFHPLHKYPGPFTSRFSRISRARALWNGSEHTWLYEIHLKYGPVARTGPDSLSFTDPRAWIDIHGFKKGVPFKDPEAYQEAPNGERNMFAEADDEKHHYQRKIFSHAFSDRALKEQEPLFNQYIEALVERIKRNVKTEPQQSFDIVKLLNFTTFDIMADLCFGESLGLLQSVDYTPWVSMLLNAFKMGARMRAVTYFEPFRTILKVWKPKKVEDIRWEHFNFSAERVNKRLAANITRPDIWGLVLANQEKGQGLSLGLMHTNAGLFMGAGTETTATELSGLVYYLLRNPACMRRLVDEITTTFPTEDLITMEGIARLPYLHACIEEGLRVFPPVPSALPRITPAGGSTICGIHVPAGTHVSVPQYASYRLHFQDAFSYRPERFLPEGAAEFAADDKSALQPFSYGPRNCLGKSVAYHEMRMVLVKLLFNFEFELGGGMEGWAERLRSFAIWEKGPLMVRARVRT